MMRRAIAATACAAVVSLVAPGSSNAQPAGALPPAQPRIVQPTPFPINTLAPLTGETSLPYPAYGTPAPGVDRGRVVPDVGMLLTLQQAIALGFARSPALASARADVGVAAAAARLAGTGLSPLVSGSASLERSFSQNGGAGSGGVTTGNGQNLGTGGTPAAGGSSATALRGTSSGFTSGSAGVSLRQLIFDGGRIAASVRAAQRSETAFADAYRRNLQTVAFNVATAYYNYLAAERTVQNDLEIVRQDQVQEDLVRAQVRAGTEARAQIATAQLPTAQARIAVVRAQASEVGTAAAFANAMGLDANVRVQPADDAPIFTKTPLSSIAVPTYDAALKRALALRPDYDTSLQTLAQAQENLRVAKLGLVPSLSGSASVFENSTTTNLGAFRPAESLGLALSVPIFDQGVTRANTAQARANIDRASANANATSLGIALNVKQTLANFVSAFAVLDQTRQEYATATSNVRATQAQYRAGVTTLPLLLNAQVQLATAQTDQVTAVYALRQAEQAYLYAVGSNYDTSGDVGSRAAAPTPVTPRPQPSVPVPPAR
ncbi:MAG: hypothetical protein NVS3B17_18860 [Vulcanimicrobiaceae bacterium]